MKMGIYLPSYTGFRILILILFVFLFLMASQKIILFTGSVILFFLLQQLENRVIKIHPDIVKENQDEREGEEYSEESNTFLPVSFQHFSPFVDDRDMILIQAEIFISSLELRNMKYFLKKIFSSEYTSKKFPVMFFRHLQSKNKIFEMYYENGIPEKEKSIQFSVETIEFSVDWTVRRFPLSENEEFIIGVNSTEGELFCNSMGIILLNLFSTEKLQNLLSSSQLKERDSNILNINDDSQLNYQVYNQLVGIVLQNILRNSEYLLYYYGKEGEVESYCSSNHYSENIRHEIIFQSLREGYSQQNLSDGENPGFYAHTFLLNWEGCKVGLILPQKQETSSMDPYSILLITSILRQIPMYSSNKEIYREVLFNRMFTEIFFVLVNGLRERGEIRKTAEKALKLLSDFMEWETVRLIFQESLMISTEISEKWVDENKINWDKAFQNKDGGIESFSDIYSFSQSNEFYFSLNLWGDKMGIVVFTGNFCKDTIKMNVFRGISLLISQIVEFDRYHSKLRHMEKLSLLGELSAKVVHEIRNPLGGIELLTTFLQSTPECSGQKEILGNINEGITTIKEILTEYLHYSKPASDTSEEVFLPDFIQGTVNLCVPKSERNKILTNIPPLKGYLKSLYLKEILMNLILNSLQAESNEISLLVELKNDFLEFKVIDDGKGIEKNHLKQVFDPFFTTKDTGTGLGMFVVRNLIARMDGSFKISSESGKGTEIQFTIPFQMKGEGCGA